MYARNKTTVVDRREILRVKLKCLAEESRILRNEERRTWGILRAEMQSHRMCAVRREARGACLAYGIIKGLTIDQMEPNRKSEPDWDAINKMVERYGPVTTRFRQVHHASLCTWPPVNWPKAPVVEKRPHRPSDCGQIQQRQ
jgi:hypothetical protein